MKELGCLDRDLNYIVSFEMSTILNREIWYKYFGEFA